MKKIYLFILCMSLLYSDQELETSQYLVGATVAFVNDSPITLYQLQQVEKTQKIDKAKAIDLLILERLKDDEAKRLQISVDDMDVENQIAQIAAQNNLNVNQFYMQVTQSGMSIDEYKHKLKDQLVTQELIRKILMQSNIGGDDEVRKYYNDNPNEFAIPKSVNVKKYVSNSKKELEDIIKQGNTTKLPGNVKMVEDKIELKDLAPQIADVFVTTKKDYFTPIMNIENNFTTFYITDKIDIEHIEFDKAKNYIVQKLILSNQEKILRDYFDKVKSRSKIVFSKFY